MFVVSVVFDVQPDAVDRFRRAASAQARTSLAEESDCLRFDVAEDMTGLSRFVLWEIYTSKAAFEDHRQTQRYEAFDRITAPWILAKTVETYALITDRPS